MSAPNESNGRPSTPEGARGVLANLPRTRPQRSTARRTAARRGSPVAGTAPATAASPVKAKADAKANTKGSTTAKANIKASTTAKANTKAKAKATSRAAAKAKAKVNTTPRAATKAKAKLAAKPAKTRRSLSKGKAEAPAKTSPKPETAARRGGGPATRTPLVRTATATKTSRPPRQAPKRPTARVDESVPRQGFESDMDRASGPVAPPGGTELMATAAEIVSELAKASVSTGERLLKDLLGHLPL